MRSERRRKAVLRGGIIKMQQVRSPLEQIGGQIAGLIVHPASREVERYPLPRRTYFNRTETVQNLLNLVHVTLRQQQQKIVVAQPGGNVRSAACLFQTPAEFLDRRVHC